MIRRLNRITQEQLFWFFSFCFIVFITYSKFLLSVAMIALLILSIFRPSSIIPLRLHAHSRLWPSLRFIHQHHTTLALALVFWMTVLSGLLSKDIMAWLVFLKTKLPYLLLPLIFINRPSLSKRAYHCLYYILFLTAAVSALVVLFQYALDYEAITYAIRKGKAIPTPFNHTRYSTIIALSAVAAFILYRQDFYLKYSWERYLLLGGAIFLFIFLHILSVRTGLLALYLAILALAIQAILRSGRYWMVLVLIGIGLALPFVAYKTIPSFRNKVDYTRYDLQMFAKGKGQNYSDSQRLRSFQVGWEILMRQPVFGIGIGDLQHLSDERYAQLYGEGATPQLPHNQFLFIAVGYGFLGLLIFLYALATPMFFRKHYTEPLFLCLHVTIFAASLVEYALEHANFIALYLFFVLAGMSYLKTIGRPNQAATALKEGSRLQQ